MDGGSQGPQRAPQQASPQAINLAHSFGREPQEGVVMKPTVNRLLARLAMFAVAIVLGAIAVAQAHKGLQARQDGSAELAMTSESDLPAAQPIPLPTNGTADAGSNYGDPYPSEYDGSGASAAYDADPGFDDQPVDYQDTPAYQEAMQQPAPLEADPYAASQFDESSTPPTAYEGGAYEDAYAGPPPPLVTPQAAPEDPAYAYQDVAEPNAAMADAAMADAAMPDGAMADRGMANGAMLDAGMPAKGMSAGTAAVAATTAAAATVAADALIDAQHDTPHNAEPVQFTEPASMPEGAHAPMDYPSDEPDPGYFPDEMGSPDGGPSMIEQPDPYPAHQQYDGAASLSIGDTRTRSVAPSYEPQPNSNPAFADPALASPPAAFADSGFAPPAAQAAAPAFGKGKPGPRELEGTQAPSLTLSKSSPAEVQVGKPATFTITVRNVGQVAAHDVLIRDEVPHGARLVDTSPTATPTQDGAILWEMGTIQAGAQVSASMEIVPTEEGEIGSVATVSFQASASSKSVSTRPQLELEHTTDRQVLVGNDVIFRIQLTNTGTGAATGVSIEEDVPDGLRHFEGRKLEFEVGTIRPQETRVLELKLKADQPGPVTNFLIARGEGDVEVTDQCELEVVAPALQVAVEGPRRRYLERQATHEIAIANPGTAPAHNVDLVARLPRALKFVNTNNAGQYDSQAHAVRWSLNELPAQEMGTVELTTTPMEIGEHRIQVTTRADMGLEDAAEHEIFVDGLAALLFTVTDVSDPIEVGGQTTYEVQVVNQGSKAATNLRLVAVIPPGMQPLNGDGPTRAVVEGQRVIFDPLARLAPQTDSFYKVHVKGLAPGDQRIKVAVISDEVRNPVTKEESTHVYSDE